MATQIDPRELDMQEQLARIRQMIAESEQRQAEVRRILAEADQRQAERE